MIKPSRGPNLEEDEDWNTTSLKSNTTLEKIQVNELIQTKLYQVN